MKSIHFADQSPSHHKHDPAPTRHPFTRSANPPINSIQHSPRLTQFRQQQSPLQRKTNNTGLPDNLKSGVENLSGYSMDDVRVHYNSSKPAQLQAHAYAQGTDIHLAPGQEKHLPHEAWHVVQQKQGRVRPTMQMKGKVNVNDDVGLEREADVMGREIQHISRDEDRPSTQPGQVPNIESTRIIQKKTERDETGATRYTRAGLPIGGSLWDSDKIARLKAQALNFIARRIRALAQGDIAAGQTNPARIIASTPHIAVILNGQNFQVAINSLRPNQGPPANVTLALQGYANTALRGLKAATAGSISHNFFKLVHTPIQRVAHWIDKRTGIIALTPTVQGANRATTHGEMQILNDGGNVPAPAAGFHRVMWVGGTKTPCHDCDHVMSPTFGAAPKAGDTPAYPDYSLLQIGGNANNLRRPYAPLTGTYAERPAVPAARPALSVGAAFPNWVAPGNASADRREGPMVAAGPLPNDIGAVHPPSQTMTTEELGVEVPLPDH